MPIYASMCPRCGGEHDYFAKVDDREHTPVCCGEPTVRKVTAPMAVSVPQDFGYKCQMTGETVTTYRQREYIRAKESDKAGCNLVDARDFKDKWAKTYQKRAEEKVEVAKELAAIPDSVKKAFQDSGPVAA